MGSKVAKDVDWLTAFGLFAVTAMLVFYAVEDRGPIFILAFAGACALGSIYGFMQGAWPFGAVEAVWCLVASIVGASDSGHAVDLQVERARPGSDA